MSQIVSDIWATRTPPISLWGSEAVVQENDQWPDLITDRLTVTRAVWKEVHFVAYHEARHHVFTQLHFDFETEARFLALAKEWKRETKYLSTIDEMITHPNYLKIIAMGQRAVPLLLRELQQSPDHWLVALNILTEEDPADPDSNFHEAVQAWILWGKERGYVT